MYLDGGKTSSHAAVMLLRQEMSGSSWTARKQNLVLTGTLLTAFPFKASDGLTIQNDSLARVREFYNFLLCLRNCGRPPPRWRGAACRFPLQTLEGLTFREGIYRSRASTLPVCICKPRTASRSVALIISGSMNRSSSMILQNGKYPWYSDRKQTTI